MILPDWDKSSKGIVQLVNESHEVNQECDKQRRNDYSLMYTGIFALMLQLSISMTVHRSGNTTHVFIFHFI